MACDRCFAGDVAKVLFDRARLLERSMPDWSNALNYAACAMVAYQQGCRTLPEAFLNDRDMDFLKELEAYLDKARIESVNNKTTPTG